MKIFPIFLYLLLPAAMLQVACAQLPKEALDDSRSSSAITPVTQPGIYLADTIVAAPGHTGSGFYDRQKAINGVRGGGSNQQGLDVFSLDNTGFNSDLSTHLILSWNGKKILNGAGVDFIVFENPFNQNNNPVTRFMDLLIVEVSSDNTNYCGFAPDYTAASETVYSQNPAHWSRFAGKTPVLYNLDSNNLTATQLFTDADADGVSDAGGGDAFDLDQLSADNTFSTGCSAAVRDDIKANGFRYLRLTPANRRINPDTAAAFVIDAASSGPDIDGVAARYIE